MVFQQTLRPEEATPNNPALAETADEGQSELPMVTFRPSYSLGNSEVSSLQPALSEAWDLTAGSPGRADSEPGLSVNVYGSYNF